MRHSAAAMASISTWCLAACSSRLRAVPALVAAARADRRRPGARRHAHASTPTTRCGPTTTRPLDASRVVAIEDANSYDFVVNTFGQPGRAARRAGDERQHRRRGARLELVHQSRSGAATDDRRPGARARSAGRRSRSTAGWCPAARARGVQPGFRMTRSAGRALSDRVRSAVESRDGHRRRDHRHRLLPRVRLPHRRGLPGGARSDAAGDLREGHGVRSASRPAAPADAARLDNVLSRGARQPNGRYRVLASRFAGGKPLGNFRYYGTRPDDPNDIVPHEHRRELRGARVFAAWLNHDDSRGVNSLDMLETARRHGATSSTTCSTSGRSSAAAPCTRSAIAPATSTSSSGSRAG